MLKDPNIWKILLIDDDEDDYLLTRELLSETRGHKVELTWAAGFHPGREALFGEDGWDAVLLDYDLGPGTGVEIIREAVARGCTSPLILLTGRGSFEVDLEAMQAGASLYLTKTEVNSLLLERSIRYAIERKQMETALRESEERYRLAARASNDAVWEWDLHQDQIRWSEALHERFGYAEGLTNTKMEWWTERIHPEDRQSALEELQRVLEGSHKFWDVEYCFRRADGTYAEVHNRGWVVRGAAGEPVRMVGAMRDLTDERAAARRVRQSEERFRKLVQVMPAAMYTLDQNGKITYFNERAAQLWGRVPTSEAPSDHFSGSMQLYTLDGEPLPKDRSPMAEAVRLGKSVRNGELIIARPDGSRITVRVNIDPLHDEEGRPAGAINVFEDVTPVKQVENELMAQARELETALARLEQIFSSEVVGIAISETSGKILEANDTYLRLTGFTRADLDTGELNWQRITPPEHLPTDLEAIALLLQTGQSPSYEKEYLRADGERIWVLVSLAVMAGDGGRMVAFVVDISAQKHADQALRESEARYSQLFNNDHTPMLLIDPQSARIIDANPAACNFYGWDHAQLTSMRITEINTLTADEAIQEMARARATAGSQVFYFRHRLASEEIREVEVHSGPIRSGSQEVLFSIVLDITERGQAEKTRTSTYQLISEILESIQDPFYSVDRNWCFTYINQRAEELWGRQRAGLLGKTLWGIFPQEDGGVSRVHMETAMHTRQVVHYETVSPLSGHWMNMHVYPTGDGGLSVFFNDIHERVQEEQRLRDALDLNDKILASSELGILVYRDSGECLLANAAAARLVNTTQASLLSQNFLQLASWERGGLRALALESLQYNQPRSHEVHFTTTFGLEVWWQCSFTPFTSAGERRLLLAIHDISKLRQSETALREGEQRYRELAETLQKEQNKLAAAIANLPVGVGLTDADGRILSLNEAALKMVGFAGDEEALAGLEDYSDLMELREPDGKVLPQEEWPLNRARAGQFEHEREVLLKRKPDGVETPVSLSVVPVRGPQGELQQMVFLLQDLSERWQAQQERERNRGQLEAIFTSLTEGVALFDTQGKLLDINPAALGLLGISSKEQAVHFSQNNLESFALFSVAGKPLPLDQSPIQRVLQGEIVENCELLVRNSSSGREWVGSFYGTPVFGTGGNPVLGLVTIREVTEKMRAEKALRESEERYRTLFSNMSEGFALGEACLDANGQPDNFRFLEINDAFEQQSGLSRDVVGRLITEALPNLERVWIDTYCAVALTGNSVSFREFNQDTNRFYDVFCYSPQSGRFAILFRDVTAQKHSDDAQRESAERFSALFRASPVPMAMTDLPSGRYIEVNDAYLDLSGYPRDELIGRTIQELELHGDGEMLKQFALDVLANGAVYNFEAVIQPKDGPGRSVLVSGVRLELSGRMVILSGVTDITELKRVQEASQSSEERFRTLADNIAQLVWMADENGALFWYNRRWYEFTGTSEAEMLGWGWRKVHHPDYLEPVENKYRQHVQAGQVWEDTFPLRGADGIYRWFLSRALPIRDEQGRVRRWFGSNTDITEQLEVEHQLKASEERFRQLADSMPQLVWTALPDGQVDYYNQRYLEYGGIAPANSGETWDWGPVLHEADLQPTTDAWAQSVATGEMFQIEHRVRLADGSYRWHLSRGIPARDANGRVFKWYGTATDIHENKLAQHSLVQRGERLALLSEAAQRLLSGGTPQDLLGWLCQRLETLLGLDVYIQYDLDEDTRALSLVAAEGLSRAARAEIQSTTLDESICGQAAERAAPVVVEDVQNDLQPQSGLIRGLGLSFYISHPLVVADRLVGTLSFGSRKIERLDAESYSLIGAVSDLVAAAIDRQRAQAALQDYSRALERSNRDLEEFAYVASHDLQEPLRKVRSFGNHLSRNYGSALDEEGNEHIRRMTQAAARMQRMIDNLLDYSRVVTRGQEFELVKMDEVVEEVLSDLEIRLRETGGDVSVRPLPDIQGDPSQMRQLLLNLMGNALKFHRPGVPPKVRVWAEAAQEDGNEARWLRLVVEDNGIGFDLRNLERIFQPFQRLHGRSEYEGNGIGLAICRKIAERHGGSITAESVPGEGSRFIVRLPAVSD